jgi:hypothetical protein
MEDMESLSMLISLKKSHLDLFAVITHIKLDTIPQKNRKHRIPMLSSGTAFFTPFLQHLVHNVFSIIIIKSNSSGHCILSVKPVENRKTTQFNIIDQ